MAKSNLYRVSQGIVERVASTTASVVPGRFDETNWGTEWMLFTGRSEAEVLRIGRKYDAALNVGRIKAPRFLKSLSESSL
jgi:hypothetical protein